MPLFRTSVTLCLIVSLVFGCETERKDSRNGSASLPSNGGEELPGYLQTIEETIDPGQEAEFIIGSTTVLISKASSATEYQVRLSRLQSAPPLTEDESLVLSSPQSDVVKVEILDPEKKAPFSSANLLIPYEFKQTFETSSPTSELGC